MKKNVLFGLPALLLVFGLIFIGCGDAANSKEENAAIVIINLPVRSERSALIDDLIDQTTSYELVVAKDGAEVYSGTFAADETAIQIELTPGIHVFTLEAFDNDASVLGRGSATSNLVAGINTVEIMLTPIFNQGAGRKKR
jgi:hypothetical protein